MEAWVIIAGGETKVSTPPRLSATERSLTGLGRCRAASSKTTWWRRSPPVPCCWRGGVVVGELGNGGGSSAAERGVGRRLDVQHFRIGAQRHAHVIRDGGVHEAELQSEVHQEWRGEAEYAAVNRFGEDHVIARAQEPEDCVDSRHAGRENEGAVAALQLGNRAFQGFAVRVIRSRVIIAFVFARMSVALRGGLIAMPADGPAGGV